MNLELCKEEYADLIVRGGICLKPGEKVQINCDVTCYDMANRVAKACYANGASKVEIRWTDSILENLDYRYADIELLKPVPRWEEEQMKQQSEQLPCLVHLLCTNPMESTEEMIKKQGEVRAEHLQVLLPYILKMRNHYKWTAVGIATQEWADHLFPNENGNLEHLWRDILQCAMVTGDGTSTEKWSEKWQSMWEHMNRLNDLKLRELHFTSELGTDLTVKMHSEAEFHCASSPDDGCAFNIPSEELYSSPIAGQTEGILVASCPLIYENQTVEGLMLQFQDGHIVSVRADKGEQFFKDLVAVDDGAAMLGEVAIIDRHSPVRALGHLMDHTLYDENAACHVAIGRGFENILKDYKNKSQEEITACGINQSAIHCDIMWGTDDSKITGNTEDGMPIVILEHGEWMI